jgi:hypothetical protein
VRCAISFEISSGTRDGIYRPFVTSLSCERDESPEENTEGTRLNGRYDRRKVLSYLRALEPMLTPRSLPQAVAF